MFLPTLNKGYVVRLWINFAELRKKLRFEDVLSHYGVEICRKGAQHLGPCPLPHHVGSRSAPCFSAHLERGIFQCFQCKSAGNILEFAALMARVDPEDGQALRKVAVELQARFCNGVTSPRRQTKVAQPELDAVVNAPLDFELKDLDTSHPFFAAANLSKETIAHFGIGYCERGLLRGRIAASLHRSDGERIGYAGLSVDNEKSGWFFPSDRVRHGLRHLFRREQVLYNAHRLVKSESVIVVQDIRTVWRLHECGYSASVATMSDSCSEHQATQIAAALKPDGRVWMLSCGDDLGSRFAHAVIEHVAPKFFVRWVRLGRDRLPSGLSAKELRHCFG